MRLIFDIETDGLLDTLTTIHCLEAYDPDTATAYSFGPGEIEQGLALLSGQHLIGHNLIGFDIPAIQRLYPHFSVAPEHVTDTLVCARLIWSAIAEQDHRRFQQGRLDGALIGAHSLAAWGQRLGRPKDDYQARMRARGLAPWAAHNREMQRYCAQDVQTTAALYRAIEQADYAPQALALEQRVAWLVARMQRNGFPFDEAGAATLYAELLARRETLHAQLQSLFAPWYEQRGLFTPKADNRRLGYTKGATFSRLEWVTFNPASRAHIAKMFRRHYGWRPTAHTATGAPKIDEDILLALDYPAAQPLAELFMLDKRIGAVAGGKQAWLKLLGPDGRIHGHINPNGTVTGRATHTRPNVSQVPAIDKPYGRACRALFHAGAGRVQLGVDASGLELRCLGHYMARYDAGAFSHEVVNGDPHSANQQAAGLASRAEAKRFIYAYLYGAGDEKIGQIVGGSAADGQRLKARFLARTPALKRLKQAVAATVERRGWLRGLDGRQLHSRSPHSALNLLLQAAGAVICKHWLVEFDTRLAAAGYHQGWAGDYCLMAWIHDEIQLSCRDHATAEAIAQIALEALAATAPALHVQCALHGAYKIGQTWADCH